MCVCVLGDYSVGLIRQHLLSVVDGINPGRFHNVQVAVLHQCLNDRQAVKMRDKRTETKRGTISYFNIFLISSLFQV